MSTRRFRKTTFILAVAMIAPLAACGGGSAARSDSDSEQIKLGLIAAMTGPAAAYGGPQRASMEAAVDRINQDGGVQIDGKSYQLDFTSYDSQYDPTVAVAAAHQAVNEDGIKFLQVDGGSIVPAVQPVAEAADVLVMALAGGDQYLGEDHPTTFRLFYDLPRSYGASLSYLMEEDPSITRVAAILTDDDLGHVLAEQSDRVSDALGVQTENFFTPRDATDFNPLLNRVLPSEPDVIQFGGTPPSLYAVIVRQARELGFDGKFIFPDSISLETITGTTDIEDVAGSVTSPHLANLNSAHGQWWVKNIGNYDAGDPSQGWAVLAYDNVFLLKAAIESANSTDVAAVAQAMREVSIEGAVGTFSYGGSREYGIDQVVEIPFPVAEIQSDGTLKEVTVVDAEEAADW